MSVRIRFQVSTQKNYFYTAISKQGSASIANRSENLLALTVPGWHRPSLCTGSANSELVRDTKYTPLIVFLPYHNIPNTQLMAEKETQHRFFLFLRNLAQLGRALRSGRRGRRFESCNSDS